MHTETNAPTSEPAPVTPADNGREARGRQIAAVGKIRRDGRKFIVPSLTSATAYTVDIEAETPTCSCPDFEIRQAKCKHVHAVEFFIIQQSNPDGTVTVTVGKRITYKQDWPAYNAAQTTEQEHVARLLRALCAGIQQPPAAKTGRPRLPLSDVVFAMVSKVYGLMSCRRAQSELRGAQAQGLVGKAAHYNSVFRGFESADLTPILKALVVESARPLASVESDFAVDSTGFGTCTYQRWFDVKHGRQTRRQKWLKLHVACGVKTNVITAAEVTDADANDCPEFIPLVKATAEKFQIREVSGDKAYLSRANLSAVVAVGGQPFVAFKSNSVASKEDGLWRKLFHFYSFKRDEYLSHYHKRSNVESTMFMLKSKFGGALRSKSETAQINETYCKAIAHNLCVLVQSFHELGVDPRFGS